ncbi:MAG: site-2 protease family protein [Pseudomonadota bacterium]
MLKDWRLITKGIPFSFTLLSILIAHEMGHYIVSKRYGVNVSLPYFIPAPSIIGTFGAFIRIKSPMRDKRALLDIGLAGPLAGAIIAIPVLFFGLKMSTIKLMPKATGMILGSSILLEFMVHTVFGDLPDCYQIALHPVGFAGWIGLLVTSLNLIPVGQLDGGHVIYAVFGEKSRKLAFVCIAGLLVLALRGWLGWFVWAALLTAIGFKHPPPLNPDIGLDAKRKWLAFLALVLLVITFIPVPFTMF